MTAKTVECAFHALVSSNMALPAWWYRLRMWERRDRLFLASKFIKLRITAVELLTRKSVAWQKKDEIFAALPCKRVNSSMISHSSFVLSAHL